MKTNNEIKRQIEIGIASWPERQITAGLYVNKVGNKYVHVTNTWDGGKDYKMQLADFYDIYITHTREPEECDYLYK